jgi:hypothetical protein
VHRNRRESRGGMRQRQACSTPSATSTWNPTHSAPPDGAVFGTAACPPELDRGACPSPTHPSRVVLAEAPTGTSSPLVPPRGPWRDPAAASVKGRAKRPQHSVSTRRTATRQSNHFGVSSNSAWQATTSSMPLTESGTQTTSPRALTKSGKQLRTSSALHLGLHHTRVSSNETTPRLGRDSRSRRPHASDAPLLLGSGSLAYGCPRAAHKRRQ